jgi:hypothetical protein
VSSDKIQVCYNYVWDAPFPELKEVFVAGVLCKSFWRVIGLYKIMAEFFLTLVEMPSPSVQVNIGRAAHRPLLSTLSLV